VRDYLITKFNEGEKTGKKSDPVGIETEMRRVRHTDGQIIFAREEWLKASQIIQEKTDARQFSRRNKLRRC
jgi:hypothetical protein